MHTVHTLVRLEWSSFKSSLDMYRESPSTTSVPDLTCTGVTSPKSPSLYWPFLTKMLPGYTHRQAEARNTSGRANAVSVDSGEVKPDQCMLFKDTQFVWYNPTQTNESCVACVDKPATLPMRISRLETQYCCIVSWYHSGPCTKQQR